MPTQIRNDFLPPLQGGSYCQCVLGLKPQAQSYSPFGTKNSAQPNYLSTFSKPHQGVSVPIVVPFFNALSRAFSTPYRGKNSFFEHEDDDEGRGRLGGQRSLASHTPDPFTPDPRPVNPELVIKQD